MPFTVAGLTAFIALHIYMGLKKQPNIKTYWKSPGSFFHYHVISNIMSRDRFFEIRRCLLITNLGTYEHIGRDNPKYDQMRQVRWLVSKIRDACMSSWVLGKFVMVDEMMVRYKGIYCLARQYMPKKPQKWGKIGA